MTAKILLFLLFVPVTVQTSTKCFICTVENIVGDNDAMNCARPTDKNTETKDCGTGCVTNIINVETHQRIIRDCAPESTSNGCKENGLWKTCFCNDNLCNTEEFTGFNCYKCGYSSSGIDVKFNDQVVSSDSYCVLIGSNTPKVECKTRCVEVAHDYRNSKGETETTLFRACEDNLERMQINGTGCVRYLQCSHDACNDRLPIFPIYAPESDN